MPKKQKTVNDPEPKGAEKNNSAAENETLKSDIEGFRGGLSINLDRELPNGQKLREVLSKHVEDVLEQELKNQSSRIDKLSIWNKQYKGVRPAKNYPWEGAANICTPITRSNVDTTFVRAYDALFNKRKIWLLRAEEPELVDPARKIEDLLDWWQRNVVELKRKALPALLQAVKTGTGILKIVYEEKKRTVYRYATPEEEEDKNTKKYKLQGTKSKAVKSIETTYDGPNIYPVSREDFVISADATDIENAYMCGFRFYLRKAQIELKARQGLYDQDAINKLIPPKGKDAEGGTNPDSIDETKEQRAELQDKELTKTSYEDPYEFWELHMKYDVDGDDEEDDIVLTIHRNSGTLVRAIYNPTFYGSRPFIALRFYPVEYCFDGEGVCEILENLQEEIDTIHNQRRDRLSIINSPPILVREGCGLDDFKVGPGVVKRISDDINTVLYEVKLSEVYPSTEREEDRLIQLADRAVGITPAVMGISTAERPVAGETQARIEEANKKFKFGHENIRVGFREAGYKVIETFAQYAPAYTYKSKVGGKTENITVEFPYELIRDGIKIDLESSTEIYSQEVRRQVNMTLYQMLGDYMTKLAGMGQVIVSPQAPSEFKKLLLEGSIISAKVMRRIVEDFDQKDSDDLVLDLSKSIDVEASIANSVDLKPPMPPPSMPPPGPGGPPGPQPPGPPRPVGPPQPIPRPGGPPGPGPGGQPPMRPPQGRPPNVPPGMRPPGM